MPTPRKHASPAARQAAHRERQRAAVAALAAAAERLHSALLVAADAGNASAALLRAESPTATLIRVAAHFEDDAAHRRQSDRSQAAGAARPGRFAQLPK